MHVPEFPLFASRHRCLMRDLSIRVNAERKILELNLQPDSIDALRLQLSKRRRELPAEGALKIRVEDDLNRCCGRASRRLGGTSLSGKKQDQQRQIHCLCSWASEDGQSLGWKFSSTIRSFVPGGRTCSVLRNSIRLSCSYRDKL